jgi:hypothetical protein
VVGVGVIVMQVHSRFVVSTPVGVTKGSAVNFGDDASAYGSGGAEVDG